MRSEMAQPCSAPACKVRKISRSTVPCKRSSFDSWFMLSDAYNRESRTCCRMSTITTGATSVLHATHFVRPARPFARQSWYLDLTVIEVDHLRKSYGDLTAVNDVSFTAH